jgi:(p)ppGpp synthase/HD superfamily hydrolase
MHQVELAAFIMDVAHTGQGQYRADKTTHYRSHPTQVAVYVGKWLKECGLWDMFVYDRMLDPDWTACVAGAYLHDVIEDTKITADDLIRYGVTQDVVDVVLLMTKPDQGPAPASYYENIAKNKRAMLVKAADRCSNLDDALTEIKSSRSLKRWKNYVNKTYTDVLPLYKDACPFLANQIYSRLIHIEVELDKGDES